MNFCFSQFSQTMENRRPTSTNTVASITTITTRTRILPPFTSNGRHEALLLIQHKGVGWILIRFFFVFYSHRTDNVDVLLPKGNRSSKIIAFKYTSTSLISKQNTTRVAKLKFFIWHINTLIVFPHNIPSIWTLR